MKKTYWPDEIKDKFKELCLAGKNNQEISQELGIPVPNIRQMRSKTGYTVANISNMQRENKERCFADMNSVTCSALEVKRCEGCVFYKSVEQKAKDDEKTSVRRESLKNKSINIFN